MVRQLEAVFEHGILRPLEPLSLPEQKRVLLTIADVPVKEEAGARRTEQEWLSTHGDEYRGQWVALRDDELLSHGTKVCRWRRKGVPVRRSRGSQVREVRDEARLKGVQHPLLVHVPQDCGEPSAGWLRCRGWNSATRSGWLDRMRFGLIDYDRELYVAPYDWAADTRT